MEFISEEAINKPHHRRGCRWGWEKPGTELVVLERFAEINPTPISLKNPRNCGLGGDAAPGPQLFISEGSRGSSGWNSWNCEAADPLLAAVGSLWGAQGRVGCRGRRQLPERHSRDTRTSQTPLNPGRWWHWDIPYGFAAWWLPESTKRLEIRWNEGSEHGSLRAGGVLCLPKVWGSWDGERPLRNEGWQLPRKGEALLSPAQCPEPSTATGEGWE